MFFGSKKVLGLDIGSSTIKIAEMNVSRSGAELQAFGFAPTPVGAINAGEIANPSALSLAIATLIGEIKTKRKKVSIGMWGTSVIVKKITIPKIDRKLIADQIRWEAEQYIPFDVNDIALSHHVIENSSAMESLDVLLIAAQNSMVYQYSQTVKESKLELSILDVSGFALANAFEANYGVRPAETIALLNIGAGNTNFVVVHNGEVVFSRDMPVGGFNYTHEIQKDMGISATEAESLKLSAVAKGEVPPEVHTIIASSNEAMTEEIRNGFDFFAASTAGLTISRCYFSGGGSGMPGLMEKVAQMANLSTEKLNCFKKVTASRNLNPSYLAQINPFAPIAMGLGLRKAGDV
jgi:type IV pilus assembly protein PilM